MKKNKIPRSKPTQGGKIPVCWKHIDILKTPWRKDIEERNPLEEIILSKLFYYSMQSTDSVQSLLKYQWHFFTELEQKFLKCVETQKTMNSQSSAEK